MKTNWFAKGLSLLFLFAGSLAVYAQEVPGDNFSLEGALQLFKKSSSPEDFEQLLNSPDSKVNNLDLNGDGLVDYIRVIDRNEGNVHAFILQAIISDTEIQDVAVIELEKLADGKAVLQIIGDEDIYGVETIIEPTEEVRVYAGTQTTRTVINVWTWPSVRYVYSPYYDVWVSPYAWSWHPYWYNTWSPVSYHVYYSWGYSYRPYYSVCYVHRSPYARSVYRPYRCTSVTVYHRHQTQITHYRSKHPEYASKKYDDGRNRGREGQSGYSSRNDRSERLNETMWSRTPERSTTATSVNDRARELSTKSSSMDAVRQWSDPATNKNRQTTYNRDLISPSRVYTPETRSNTGTAPQRQAPVQKYAPPTRSTQRESSVQKYTLPTRSTTPSKREYAPQQRTSITPAPRPGKSSSSGVTRSGGSGKKITVPQSGGRKREK